MKTANFIAPEFTDFPAGHCVYMLLCADGTYYTGWTTDFNQRLAAHNSGKGAKYTRSRLPAAPAYLEYVPDRSAGLKREAAIKKLTRPQKDQLINSKENYLNRHEQRYD